VISPKYDGMAGCHYKERGLLATRGDGYKGENVTDKIPLINFEQKEKTKTFGKSQQKVYGEVVIKKSDFEKCILTRKDGSKFKTPRNLVAGVMNPNRKDTEEIKGKVLLTFVQHNSQTRVCTKDVIANTWDNIVDVIESIDYPIDGIVIKLQDTTYGKTLGSTSHHPRHSIAFKFPDESKWAKVINIDWQVGKRKITPVCYIEPTILDGVTIKKITLHNAKNVLEMDLQEGDEVSIVRRGGVIPYVESSRPGKVRKRPIIELCPSCQEQVFYDPPELVCKNRDCDGSIKKKLLTAAKILEIDGLSVGTISKIVEYFQGEVVSVADLLTLRYEDFIELDGFADKSAQKLEDNILVVTQGVEDWKLLACLALDGIGRTLSKQLLARVNLGELRQLTEDDLYDYENMGPERIDVLVAGLANHGHIIDKLIQDINIIETKLKRSSVSSPIKITKTICFSGSFAKPKRFYQQHARENGLVVTDSVTKKLDYLVTAGASTSKVNKARSYGITILKADDFMSKVEKL
jgi:DNA ligase (NAD+)